MLAHRVRVSLVALQVVGVATLMRSIAYDRWITVLASLLLIGGAVAAQRGRTWGIALAFATAVSFPVAFAIGIAPPWFCLVGLAGALPFALTARRFARFDPGATALLAGIAATTGAAVAMAWKELAWTVFTTFPSLTPSMHAQHGLALATTAAVVVGVLASQRRVRLLADDAATHVRVAEGVSVSRISYSDAVDRREAFDDATGEDEDDAVAPERSRRAR